MRTHDFLHLAKLRRRSARLVRCALLSAAIVALASLPARAALFDDVVFAHDFETISGDDITALYGPNATKENMAVSTTDPLAFSNQHLRTPNDEAHANVDTNTQLTSAMPNLSFSMYYNAQGDDGADNGSARFLSTYEGFATVDPGNLIFQTQEATTTTRHLRLSTGAGGANSFAVNSVATIPNGDSDWHQVGFVFEGGLASSTLTFYFDGAQLGAPVVLSGITQVDIQDRNWFLAEDAEFGGLTREYFAGGFYDEAALWTRALSAQEMANIHDFGLAGTGAVAIVPEPSSFVLLGLGALGWALCALRKRRRR